MIGYRALSFFGGAALGAFGVAVWLAIPTLRDRIPLR